LADAEPIDLQRHRQTDPSDPDVGVFLLGFVDYTKSRLEVVEHLTRAAMLSAHSEHHRLPLASYSGVASE
jgi:hypothetical protein